MAELLVDADRLRGDLDALAQIGRSEDGGIYRRAFTPADMAGRKWLVDRLEEAGLEPRVDGAGNLGARVEPTGAGDEDAPVMTGSHLDTVPGAGQLDGALGVVAGLEVLRTLTESGAEIARPVELVAFSDEEGRFGGMLGSQAMSGRLTPEWIELSSDLDGVPLSTALAECGFRAMDVLSAERDRDSIHAFVELHIEQGPVLERRGEAIGLVDAITGLFRWDVRFVGEANHAGTTPMDMRRDAFQALTRMAGRLEGILDEHGSERSRATIGRVEILPGAANVVPGEARLSIDVRDTDANILADLATAIRTVLSEISIERGIDTEIEVVSELAPVACDERVMGAVAAASARLGIEPLRMPSGAAHDTQMMATLAPAGMIFVPSRGGRSHSPAEWTSPADIERGANVLLHTILELAR